MLLHKPRSVNPHFLTLGIYNRQPIEFPEFRLRYIQSMRAILAGGGTGGHVIPALAIANQLKKSYDAECLFIGTARGIENRLVPAAGFPLQLVRVGALKNVSLLTRLWICHERSGKHQECSTISRPTL